MSNKKNIGYIAGVYDMFNVEHLNMLKNAKAQSDYLIVGIYSDKFVEQVKNKKTIIPFEERAAIIESIRYVDKVIPQTKNDISELIETVKNYGINVVFSKTNNQGTEEWNAIEKKLAKIECKVIYVSQFDTTEETIQMPKKRTKGIRVGYTTGVFDMFHIGHLNILKNAKTYCDYLIVGVSTDECVQSYKNKTPVVPFKERLKIVKAMKYVDEAVPQITMDKFEAWKKIGFNLLFHGSDWKGSLMYDEIEKKLSAVGCKVVFLPHTDGISSTLLREKLEK